MKQLCICKGLNFFQNWVSGQEFGNAKELRFYTKWGKLSTIALQEQKHFINLVRKEGGRWKKKVFVITSLLVFAQKACQRLIDLNPWYDETLTEL